MRPATLADAVARSRLGPAPLYAHVNEFLDEFHLHPDRRAGMIADEPEFPGDPRQDAWIGGVGEHLARQCPQGCCGPHGEGPSSSRPSRTRDAPVRHRHVGRSPHFA